MTDKFINKNNWLFFSSAKPQWVQTMRDNALSIEERLFWECKANGKPKPSYSWLKNGELLAAEVKFKQWCSRKKTGMAVQRCLGQTSAGELC